MKTIFNKNYSGKIAIPVLITILFILMGIVIFKKTRHIEKETIFSQKLEIDTTSDSRALGYSGQRKIVKDSKGNIFVSYRKDYQKNSEIFVTKISHDVAGFHIYDTDKPIAVLGKNNDQRVPSLAIDANDTLHAVWYGSDTEGNKNNRQVKYARKPAGAKNWESWRNIAHVSGYTDDEFWQEHPMLLASRDNTLFVVWEGKDEEHAKQQIKFSKSINNGLVWTKWKNIAPSKNGTQSRPTLVEDKNGKLFLFSYSSADNEEALQQIQYTSSSDQGETWTPWKVISNPAFDSRHISAATNESGELYVVWRAQTTKDGPTQIMYRTLTNNNWSGIRAVYTSAKYQFFPNVGTTQAGAVYVSWMENSNPSEFPRENPTAGIGLVSFLKRGAFQSPTLLSEQANLLYPTLGEKINTEDFVPIFYAEQTGGQELKLNLKFLDSSHMKNNTQKWKFLPNLSNLDEFLLLPFKLVL